MEEESRGPGWWMVQPSWQCVVRGVAVLRERQSTWSWFAVFDEYSKLAGHFSHRASEGWGIAADMTWLIELRSQCIRFFSSKSSQKLAHTNDSWSRLEMGFIAVQK